MDVRVTIDFEESGERALLVQRNGLCRACEAVNDFVLFLVAAQFTAAFTLPGCNAGSSVALVVPRITQAIGWPLFAAFPTVLLALALLCVCIAVRTKNGNDGEVAVAEELPTVTTPAPHDGAQDQLLMTPGQRNLSPDRKTPPSLLLWAWVLWGGGLVLMGLWILAVTLFASDSRFALAALVGHGLGFAIDAGQVQLVRVLAIIQILAAVLFIIPAAARWFVACTQPHDVLTAVCHCGHIRRVLVHRSGVIDVETTAQSKLGPYVSFFCARLRTFDAASAAIDVKKHAESSTIGRELLFVEQHPATTM
jgi:hypothetical protein